MRSSPRSDGTLIALASERTDESTDNQLFTNVVARDRSSDRDRQFGVRAVSPDALEPTELRER
jgi:hypothetical protein